MNSHSYTSSIHYDRRLYGHDIAGSIAHVRMLAKQGIISLGDSRSIVTGLDSILKEIEDGVFPWSEELEDIHMNVERRLYEKIGDVAGKLHTARSRNDQVALDIRLYAKDAIRKVLRSISRTRVALLNTAEENLDAVLPGYTHLQRGQPVLFAHHLLAYFEMFGRDVERFNQAHERTDVMPLGSGALAGVPYQIDRQSVADDLGFNSITHNSMDAVSDRDFLLDFHSASAICAVHLSRLSEELVIWSSEEFSFIKLADPYTTGSSIMPQKRNPDFVELARGRTGRVFGHLVALLTVLKGLPLTYNRDLQEDKEGFFDTADTLTTTLDVVSEIISTMLVDVVTMRRATDDGYMLATDVADYLVGKGVPFREAHGLVNQLVMKATREGKRLDELPLETYHSVSPDFSKDVLSISVDSSISSRDVPGGTALSRVVQAIKVAKVELEAENEA